MASPLVSTFVYSPAQRVWPCIHYFRQDSPNLPYLLTYRDPASYDASLPPNHSIHPQWQASNQLPVQFEVPAWAYDTVDGPFRSDTGITVFRHPLT